MLLQVKPCQLSWEIEFIIINHKNTMCFDGTGYLEKDINGKCEKCGEPTVDGKAFECCGYSAEDCDKCGRRSCDGSC